MLGSNSDALAQVREERYISATYGWFVKMFGFIE
jgi:hypothetical protein